MMEVISWVLVGVLGIGIVLLARNQPLFPLGLLRKWRRNKWSVYEWFILVFLFGIFLLRLIANDPTEQKHIFVFIEFFYVIIETVGIAVCLMILILLDREVFPKQQLSNKLKTKEEIIHHENKEIPNPEISSPNREHDEGDDEDLGLTSSDIRSGNRVKDSVMMGAYSLGRYWGLLGTVLVLHLGGTAGWALALWYYDDPEWLAKAFISFFVIGAIVWILALVAIIKAYLNH